MEIEQFIPFGRENAISRRELVRLTGIPDRKVREIIKLANRRLKPSGVAILSSSAQRGYWRTDDISEMEAYLRENDHRRAALAVNDEPIRQLVAEAKGRKYIYVSPYIRRWRKEPEEPEQIDGQTKLGGQ